MKVDVDLTEIFEDEHGGSIKLTLADRLIESVADKVLTGYRETLDKSIQTAIDKKLAETLDPVLEEKLRELFDNLLDYEFVEVTNWGSVKGKGTLRNRIIEALEKNSVYKKSSYRSDKNTFSEKLDDVIAEQMKPLIDDMRKVMTTEFKKMCIAQAAEMLQKKL